MFLIHEYLILIKQFAVVFNGWITYTPRRPEDLRGFHIYLRYIKYIYLFPLLTIDFDICEGFLFNGLLLQRKLK